MIDLIDSLAFSIESNKGVYALLVGSGISLAAEIPTGEKITSELIRRLARLNNWPGDPELTPASWFRQTFGEEPDYSILLSQLGKTQIERYNLLKEFFEPSEDERRRGAKMPTKAHKAIAQLVSKGFIKIIITTNFDRLLEKALDEIGIDPVVISTSDLAENAPSIVYTKCTIIKVNGDYLDPRIRNTYSELEKYDDATNKLLDQILDDFGLIVCGWSAEWDIALQRAFERCKNYRFSTYWTDIREPGEKAKRLIAHRKANFLSIIDADSFFQGIADRVEAIESFKKPHPISKQIAVARVKKYLVSDAFRIELHDLLFSETEQLFENLSKQYAQNDNIRSYKELEERLHILENLTESVLSMMITGCYWGSEIHKALWIKCIERIANISSEIECKDKPWLVHYPALLLFYGGGIASIANSNFQTFAEIVARPVIIIDHKVEVSPALSLIPEMVIDENEQKKLFSDFPFNKWTPFSNYLFGYLKGVMKEFLHDDNRYKKYFDQFEYMVSLQHAFLRLKQGNRPYGPIGCFGWRYRDLEYDKFVNSINEDGLKANKEWKIFKGGLFDREYSKFIEIKDKFDKSVAERTFGWI